MYKQKENRIAIIISFVLAAGTALNAQVITQSNGLKLVVVYKDFPLLKILLPGQRDNDRGIEVEFPEHVTGVEEKTNEVRQLYFVTNRNSKRTLPVWHVEGKALIYQSKLNDAISLIAKATLEEDGVRYTYSFTNHSNVSYTNFQAVTCVKLYNLFSDTLLQRTYVHHAEGFDLVASETPERLTLPQEQWWPCRYLVSYTWPINKKHVEKVEDGITHYHKSRKTDRPMIATYSKDHQWVAATYTKETGNLWTNPERSCHHADPVVTLKAEETKVLTLKTFVIRGNLDQVLSKIDEAEKNN